MSVRRTDYYMINKYLTLLLIIVLFNNDKLKIYITHQKNVFLFVNRLSELIHSERKCNSDPHRKDQNPVSGHLFFKQHSCTVY